VWVCSASGFVILLGKKKIPPKLCQLLEEVTASSPYLRSEALNCQTHCVFFLRRTFRPVRNGTRGYNYILSPNTEVYRNYLGSLGSNPSLQVNLGSTKQMNRGTGTPIPHTPQFIFQSGQVPNPRYKPRTSSCALHFPKPSNHLPYLNL
jgi:hypothetical protein